MRVTKRQLKRMIRESCGLSSAEDPIDMAAPMPEMPTPADAPVPEASNVPVPEDYQATRNFLDQNPDLVDMALQGIMDAVGTGCQRSTAQAVVDHMQDMLGHDAPPEDDLNQFLAGVVTQ